MHIALIIKLDFDVFLSSLICKKGKKKVFLQVIIFIFFPTILYRRNHKILDVDFKDVKNSPLWSVI